MRSSSYRPGFVVRLIDKLIDKLLDILSHLEPAPADLTVEDSE